MILIEHIFSIKSWHSLCFRHISTHTIITTYNFQAVVCYLNKISNYASVYSVQVYYHRHPCHYHTHLPLHPGLCPAGLDYLLLSSCHMHHHEDLDHCSSGLCLGSTSSCPVFFFFLVIHLQRTLFKVLKNLLNYDKIIHIVCLLSRWGCHRCLHLHHKRHLFHRHLHLLGLN